MECLFRKERAAGEAAIATVLCLLAVAPFGPPVDRLGDLTSILIPGAALSLLVQACLVWGRWRSRIVLDDRGVERRRSRRSGGTRLEWDEVDEFFLFGDAGFELRGGGRRISFGKAYGSLYPAREFALPRLSGMRERLRSRAAGDGSLGFRMPGGRWKAHLAYLAAVLVLTGITGYCAATLLDRKIKGLPFIVLFFGGSWLWGLRKRASGLGTRVTLRPEGLVVRRLDGKDRVSWGDLERVQWNARGGLDLVLRSRRVISLPSALANIGLLEEFIQEGSRLSDSEARGPAGDRTMMQSP